MKAIILAAGRGSRMEEATERLPKCLINIFGKPILDYCIESLQKAGFEAQDIGIVTGYKKETIKLNGTKMFYNANWETTNMFISLTMAEEWLLNEPCIVCYSDILFNKSAIELLMNNTADIAITYYTKFWELWEKRFDNPLDDLETFKINGEQLVKIGEKPTAKEDIQGQYMGLLRITPMGWNNITTAIKSPMKKTVEKLDMTTLLQHLITSGVSVVALKTDDLWLECDNMNDVRVYEKLFDGFETGLC